MAVRAAAAALTAAGAGCGDKVDQTGATPPARSSEPVTGVDQSPGPVPREIALGPELTAAMQLIERQQTDVARSRLEPYVAQHPDHGPAKFLLGLTYHREKRYTLARPHFEAAASLEPDYHPTHHFLGWCLYYLGDMPGARAAFENHLALKPGEGDSTFAIGLIDFNEDRLDDAVTRFTRAIELQANNPRRVKDVAKAHARLADVHIRRDELEAARSRLRVATGLWPQHYAAFYKLSRVLNRLGETEAAAEAFGQYRYWEARAEKPRGVPEPPPGSGR